MPVKVMKGGRVSTETRDIKVGPVSGPMSAPSGYRKLTEEEYLKRLMATTPKK